MRNDLSAEQLRQPIMVTLPLSAVLRLADIEAAQPTIAHASALPGIGADFQGGKYAGLTIHDNAPHALILLPGEFKGDWKTSLDWADKEDGELPSRFDALVLFQNLKAEFKTEWYWTSAQLASDPSYAWVQDFGLGRQSCLRVDYGYRARAVRRVAI